VGILSYCWHLTVNLKEKNYLYVISTTQRCPNKIIQTFLIEDFFHLPPVSATPWAAKISANFKKIWNGPNGILWGMGEIDTWKNLMSKISWHSPFNRNQTHINIIPIQYIVVEDYSRKLPPFAAVSVKAKSSCESSPVFNNHFPRTRLGYCGLAFCLWFAGIVLSKYICTCTYMHLSIYVIHYS